MHFKPDNLVIIVLIATSLGCTPSQDHLIADETNTSKWLAYGRTHSEQRFSPLKDLDTTTVSQLKVDWYLDLPNDVALVSTPLVVDGVLYFTGTMNRVRAVDATNGKTIWEFDPEVAKHVKDRKPGWTQSRGLSYYKGKIFLATWEGRLIAVDAKTGKQLWSALTIESGKKMNITGAPKAFAGKVLIGNGGSEATAKGWPIFLLFTMQLFTRMIMLISIHGKKIRRRVALLSASALLIACRDHIQVHFRLGTQ